MTNEKRGKQWTAPTESFGVLDVAWSPDCVAISEVGEFNLPQQIKAGVRCFSRDGKLLWRYRAQNDHVGPLRFRPNKNSFVGIDFTSGTAFKLIELDSLTGQVIHEAALPEFGLPAFFGDGEGYLYADSATHGANVYSL